MVRGQANAVKSRRERSIILIQMEVVVVTDEWWRPCDTPRDEAHIHDNRESERCGQMSRVSAREGEKKKRTPYRRPLWDRCSSVGGRRSMVEEAEDVGDCRHMAAKG